jgi:translation initiation factor IF-2
VAGTFVAVTGGGCPAANNASYFAAYLAGWPVENLSGGWTGRGCTDRFWAVPMSGSANSDPGDTYVLWFFVTAPVTSGGCDIWAYIPKTGRDRDVAGNPTTYEVLRSKEDQKVIGTFSIRQPEHRGTWAHGGTFGFDGGKIAVKLRNRGTGTGDARHAAAQVLVHCKPR